MCFSTTSIILSFISSYSFSCSISPSFSCRNQSCSQAISCAPTLDVMIMIVFLKSTVRPFGVRQTSILQNLQQHIEYHPDAPSRFHRIELPSTAWYGPLVSAARLRHNQHIPGDPTSFDTECFSHIFRHIETDHRVFITKHFAAANALVSSVLPTPVGRGR